MRKRRKRYSVESNHCNGTLRNRDAALFVHFQTRSNEPKAAYGSAVLGRQSPRQSLEQVRGRFPFDLGVANGSLVLAVALQSSFPFALELTPKARRGFEESGDGKWLAPAVYEIHVA